MIPSAVRNHNGSKNQRAWKAAFELFHKGLKAEWKGQRRPKGFRSRLRMAQDSDRSSIERIFLDANSSAWFAYDCIVEDIGATHYSG